MTREKVETAICEGIPFLIEMEDGQKHKVADRFQVALGKTTVIVVGKNDMPQILALSKMTGISFLKST